MKKKKEVECPCGEVEFSTTWQTEGNYNLLFCPFCGISIEEESDVDDEEDDYLDDE